MKKWKMIFFIIMALLIISSFVYGEGYSTNVNEGFRDKLASIISNPFISTLFLTLGFVGMVIEIFTPGFGIGGVISIVFFGLFFGGNIIAGNSHWASLLFFIIGLILLVVEAMVPGFGLPGISGIIMLAVGIIMATGDISSAVMSLSVALMVTAVVAVVFIKIGYKSPLFNKIVLETKFTKEKGYNSSSLQEQLLDKEGVAITDLRPSGIIEIDGTRIDALSEGNYIDRGAQVKIYKVEGSKIFVRRL